jgi:hypothetical protein
MTALPNIQMQKTGVEAFSRGEVATPASDLGRWANIYR